MKLFEGLPKKARIGTVWYRFFLKERLFLDEKKEDVECVGLTYANEKKIEFSTSHHNYNMIEILFHELIHAVYVEYRLKEKQDEETVCSTFGKALCQIFLDNPKLLDYINEHIKYQRKNGNCY